MSLIQFDRSTLIHPREELVEFIQRVIYGAPDYTGLERRNELRCLVVMALPAVALDEHLQPCGQPFAVISRDVSHGGMGFFHSAPLPTDSLLTVELRAPDGQKMQVVLEVRYCRPEGGAFQMGGAFLVKMYDSAG